MFDVTKNYINSLEEKVQDNQQISIDNLVELHNNINEDIFRYEDDAEHSLQEMSVDNPSTLAVKFFKMRNAEKCMYDTSMNKGGVSQLPQFLQTKQIELSKELDDADAELDKIVISLHKADDSEKQLRIKQGELAEKEREYTRLKESISELETKISELEKTDLNDLRSQQTEYMSDYDRIFAEYTKVTNEYTAARQAKETIENNLKEANKDKEKLEKEKEELNQKFEETQKMINELPHEIEKLRAEVEQQKDTYTDKLREMSKNKKDLQDEFDEIKRKKRQVDEDIQELSRIYKIACEDKIVMDLYAVDGAKEILKVEEDGSLGVLPQDPETPEELNLWFEHMENVIKNLIYVYGDEYKKILKLIKKKSDDIDK